MTIQISQYEARVLVNINIAEYRQSGRSWFAYPVMGQPYPVIRNATVQDLISRNLVYVHGGILHLTERTKRKLTRT